MSWSPDQEIVIFITGNFIILYIQYIKINSYINLNFIFEGDKKIIEMNKFFDVLNEIPIEVDEFGEGKIYSKFILLKYLINTFMYLYYNKYCNYCYCYYLNINNNVLYGKCFFFFF